MCLVTGWEDRRGQPATHFQLVLVVGEWYFHQWNQCEPADWSDCCRKREKQTTYGEWSPAQNPRGKNIVIVWIFPFGHASNKYIHPSMHFSVHPSDVYVGSSENASKTSNANSNQVMIIPSIWGSIFMPLSLRLSLHHMGLSWFIWTPESIDSWSFILIPLHMLILRVYHGIPHFQRHSFFWSPFGQVAHSHQRGERRPGGGCSPHFGCPDK